MRFGYLDGEKESVLRFDKVEQTWYAWTSIAAHARKFAKQGWTLTNVGKVNGAEVDWSFTAPKNAVTFRNLRFLCSKPVQEATFGGCEVAGDRFIDRAEKKSETARQTLLLDGEKG